jgi:hypothetical protein
MKLIVMGLICFCSTLASAQEQQVSSTTQPSTPWKHGMVAALTLTQVSFTDWAAGGENALSWTFSTDGKSTYDAGVLNWANAYSLAFGQTRLGDKGLRKTDDKIDLESILTYKLGALINPYAAVTLKTQFAKGFIYDASDNRTQVSAFFDPAYLTQSVGAGYQPMKEVKTRLGLAVREIFTQDFNQYADDHATTEVEKTRVEGGIESVTDVEWQLEENLLFTAKLELFAPIKTMDEVVVRSNSSLTAKVNKYVTAILNVQLINEKRITPRTQMKETLALGLSYTVF